MTSAPPLTPAGVAVQQMRPATFTDLQRRRFQEFFPFFLDTPAEGRASSLGVPREPAYGLRRFSGGADLRRGRYFALTDVGDVPERRDLTTVLGTSPLVGELLAYAHDLRPDWTSVFDLRAAPGRFDELLDDEQKDVVAAAGGNVIGVFDRPLREGADPTARERGYLFPYRVESLERARALDLRRPETLDWLITALNDDFPNVAFPLVDEETPEQDLTWFVRDVTTPEQRDRILAGIDLPVGRGLRDIGQALDGVGDVLAYLLNDCLGGTHVTDVIATCAIDAGADCIVYPSARVDCGVAYDVDGPHSWWGWNLVDLAGATSHYSDCLVWIGRPERFYGRPDLTVLQDQADEGEPSATATAAELHGWAVDGLTQNTTSVVHTRRWLRALERSTTDVEITFDVERTARRGRHGEFARTPRRYENLAHLRADLACRNVRLESEVLAIDDLPRQLYVGDLLAGLASEMPLHRGEVPVPTVYAGAWFLLQSPEPTSFVLLCPICGTTETFGRELDFSRMAHCRSCRYGWIVDEEPMDAAARAFAAVDDGLDLLWPDATT